MENNGVAAEFVDFAMNLETAELIGGWHVIIEVPSP